VASIRAQTGASRRGALAASKGAEGASGGAKGALALPSPSPSLLPRMIKVEANFLRLPLFALHTRGLNTLDGIECRGKAHRDGVTHEFAFQATRNTATSYPGPLARSAHLAFLSLVTDRGFPLVNPITWTWRDLCRRMGITYSGRAVLQLKAAIRATQGLLIRSQHALYSKKEGQLVHNRERGFGLYDEVGFASERLPDGRVADTNQLRLSAWYLENLNAFFTAPLDHDLWRALDVRSPIASRLYEFLLLNFYGGAPLLRINYENLAQFLPVRRERYASDAKKQLGPALVLIAKMGIVEKVEWSAGKGGGPQLHFFRGPRLAPSRDAAPLPREFVEDDPAAASSAPASPATIAVRELRNVKPEEWTLVSDFYREWGQVDKPRPTAKELVQAREILREHGPVKAKTLVHLAIRRMRVEWPDAKSFAAVGKFLGDAALAFEKERRRAEGERAEEARRREAREEEARRQADWETFEAHWRPRWLALPEAERTAIRRAVVGPRAYLAHSPTIVEGMCLEELARRNGGEMSP